MPKKVLAVLSGGQDSTTCLYLAKKLGHELHAVTFDYGQRHNREVLSAVKIANMAGVVTHEVVELGPILKGTSPLVSDAKLEQYANHNSLPGGLEKTFVPMRNQLFLTLAANRAYVLGATTLITGVSEEDYGGYPDCRMDFIYALEDACNRGTFCAEDSPGELGIWTPLIHMSKADEVLLSCTLEGCYGALAWSHTGYDGAYPPTGKDHATLLRAKGFEKACVPDPLILRAVEAGLMPIPDTMNYRGVDLHSWRERLRKEGGLP